jgi:DNA-binding LacI/PurR family transcriptional regulator
MQIPQRTSLVAQTAELLRNGIRDGEWRDHLPPERELSERFKVSRRTTRSALQTLQREGIIRAGQGKRRHIAPGTRRVQRRSTANAIGILWMESPTIQAAHEVLLFRALEAQLHAAGYAVELHMGTGLMGRQLDARLGNLVSRSRAGCWLLNSAAEPVQRWFAAKGIPAALAGSPHPGVRLPSFDADFRAVCRHAAQTLLRLGHHHCALLMPRTRFAGDLRSAEGFREPFVREPASSGLVIHHDGTVTGVQHALDTLFRSDPAPTALLVSVTTHVLTVLSHLARCGRRVPGDVSLISRDHDEFLAHLTPSVARYVFSREAYAARISRALLQLARGGAVAAREVLIYPQFCKGETLAPPGATASPG